MLEARCRWFYCSINDNITSWFSLQSILLLHIFRWLTTKRPSRCSLWESETESNAVSFPHKLKRWRCCFHNTPPLLINSHQRCSEIFVRTYSCISLKVGNVLSTLIRQLWLKALFVDTFENFQWLSLLAQCKSRFR